MKYSVTPILAQIQDSVKLSDLVLFKPEVEEIFTLPIEGLISPQNFGYTQFRIQASKPGYSLPVFTVANRRIWGLSAFVLHMALRALIPRKYRPKLKYHHSVFT